MPFDYTDLRKRVKDEGTVTLRGHEVDAFQANAARLFPESAEGLLRYTGANTEIVATDDGRGISYEYRSLQVAEPAD